MARQRYNGLTATLDATGLTAAATSIGFTAALSSMAGAVPTLAAGDYIVLVVDGEIIHLTAYTTGALTGTIERAKEGTTAATHAAGATVANDPTIADFDEAMPYVSVRRSANLALAAATATPVPYDVEIEDTHGFHSTTTNSDRLTVPAGLGGVYAVSVSSEFAGPSGTDRTIHLRKNGGSDFIDLDTRLDAAGTVRPKVAAIVRLADGDYVQALAYGASSGTTLNYAWGGTPSLGYPTFSMVRLGK